MKRAICCYVFISIKMYFIIFYKIFMEQQNMQQCSHLYMNKTELRDMVPQNIHMKSDSPRLFLL